VQVLFAIKNLDNISKTRPRCLLSLPQCSLDT